MCLLSEPHPDRSPGLIPAAIPDARLLVDRSCVLVKTMLDRPDEAAPNFVLLQMLYEQLQQLHDIFEDSERQQLKPGTSP
ncbi:hypothetical protein GTGU_00004 [Trabulsiella guamensis ATCC 49490]|uniref:Uncharacterized protein n=1 Tax=Trabulsiella guamensis ATCC 49490 TaxID=1005994 RepID=A0A085AST1_9ENTR|nr:hypothetical protein GTGU_00004 [Trabulsiella guamensis ATCC 49490]